MDDGIKVVAPSEAFQWMVKTFHMGIGGQGPDAELRVKLIQEEAEEFINGVKNRDAVETLDALCDLLYVVYGTADVYKVYLETEQSSKTEVIKLQEPRWADLHGELEDFNLDVSEVVVALRTGQFGEFLADRLTWLADGCWSCAAEAMGVDLRPFFREVHRTNMHKLQGPKRADGKQLKPEGWKPPRIKAMYERVLSGRPAICDTIQCVDGGRKFDIAERVEHDEGGYHCLRCGGFFVEIELDVGMEMKAKHGDRARRD